jgi:ribosomal protein S18 acetylase RimI-like enzyme
VENPRNPFTLMRATPSFKLRPANADDATIFYRVIDQTMREFILATWGRWDEERVQRESHEKCLDPDSQIIQVDEQSAGVFVAKRYSTHTQLEQIYLLPEYQRLRIGTALLNGLTAEAAQAKIPVRLRVLLVNPAKNFYERFGFVVIETTGEFFYMEKVQ